MKFVENSATPAPKSVDPAVVSTHESMENIQAILSTYIADCPQEFCRSIHGYLGQVGPNSKPLLMRNLLHIELERQRAAGQDPDVNDYLREFPEHAFLIRQVFLESASLSFSRTLTGKNVDVHNVAAATSMHVASGVTHLGDYLLLREIGRGGMGAVYEAVHLRSGERVALKTLPSVDGTSLHRFKREFRSMAEINHPNLIGLHSLESDGGHWFFTMDLIEGSDFLSFVRPAGILDGVRLRRGLAQLVSAILSLHSRKVIHRDLKPSNVMVSLDGRVVVLDFGLVLEEQGRDLSQTGHIAGTPAYMAPEQAFGKVVSGAADWYSVGVILYEALSGTRPFVSPSVMELLRKKTVEDAPPISPDHGLPEDLVSLAMALLARDPAKRPEPFEIARRTSDSQVPSTVTGSNSGSLLVGRDRQLAELRSAYDEVHNARQALAVFISGRSGEGKSALIEHFLQSSSERNPAPVMLIGRCYDRESVPFKALDSLIDSLASYLRKLPDLESALLMPDDIGFLTALFPVMQRVPSVEKLIRKNITELDQQQVRKRAFTALRALLNRTTQRAPVILVADDLQWGDSDSAEALFEVLRSPDSPAVLFIGSYRSDEVALSPFLTKWKSSNEAQDERVPDRIISVSPLSLEDCTSLTIALVGQDTESVRRRAFEFHQATAGNPFLLTELIGCFDPASDSFRVIPIDEVIETKLARLPDAAASLLNSIAVSGQALAIHEAVQSAGLPGTALSVLTHMRSEKLIRLLGSQEDSRVDTYHDKIRESVLERMDPAFRRSIHSRMAEIIQSSADPDSEDRFRALESGLPLDNLPPVPRLFDLAFHFNAAGDSRKAFYYALLAAEQAAQQFSQQAAAEQFAVARRNCSVANPALRFRIARGEARALSLLGQYEAAARLLEGQETLTAVPYEQAQILGLRAEIAHKQGKIVDGVSLYSDALRKLGHRIPTSNFKLCLKLAREAVVQALHTVLPKWCYQKRENPSPEDALAVELANRNSIVSYYGNTIRMLWTHLKGLNLAETRLPSPGLAYAYGLHPAPVAAIGLFKRGVRYSEIAVKMASEKGDLLTQGHCFSMRSMAQYASGHYAEAVESAETGIAMLTKAGDPYVLFIAESHASFSYWRLSNVTAAIEIAYLGFDRAVRLGEEASVGGLLMALTLATDGKLPFRELRACFGISADDHLSASFVGLSEGIWHARNERWEEAINVFGETWRRAFRNWVIVPYSVAIVAWLAMAQRRYAETMTGSSAAKTELLQQAWRNARMGIWLSLMYPSERAHALREYGLLLCHRGKRNAGLRRLRSSIAIAERQGDEWQLALSNRECGRIELQMGIEGGADRIVKAKALLSRVASETEGFELRCLKLVQDVGQPRS